VAGLPFRKFSPIFRDLEQESPVFSIAHEERRSRDIRGANPAFFGFA